MKVNIIVLVSLFFTSLTLGRIINVPGDQATIQAGIDAAVNGDTVLVAENTYLENINFIGKAITVASVFIMDGDTSHISKTIIDGSQPANPNRGSVVFFESGEDTTSVLCGFTITGGTGVFYGAPLNIRVGGGIICGFSGATVRNNYIINNTLNDETVNSCGGGGINSGPPGSTMLLVIENNVIENNTITSAGVHNLGAGLYIGSNCRIDSNIVINNSILSTTHEAAGGGMLITQVDSGIISNNIVENNHSFTDSDSFIGSGGGAYFWSCNSSHLVIQNNQFKNNEVKSAYKAGGGGVTFENCNDSVLFIGNVVSGNIYSGPETSYGGGIYVKRNSLVQIIDNTITQNEASLLGGGIAIKGSSPLIKKNTITHNQAVLSGGGISCHTSSNPEIINNLIAYNAAGEDAGGIYIANTSNPALINNTIVENEAKRGGAIAANYSSDPLIINTIFYFNRADSGGNQLWFWDDTSDPSFIHCDIEGGSAAFGFYSDSYTFSGVYKNNLDSNPLFVAGDSFFHLSDSSPCIGAGNSEGCPDADLFGNPRPYPVGTNPDIGAHESELGEPDGIHDKLSVLPNEFYLFQNYPNPFNPATVISYQLSAVSQVDLSVYNILGQKVATLVSGKQKVGNYEVEWEANGISSGVYFYIMKIDNRAAQARKMIVLK